MKNKNKNIQSDLKQEGSKWFNRLQEDLRIISSQVRFKRIKYGFYRVYYKDAYIGELYKEMPEVGYDILELDMRVIDDKEYVASKIDDGEVQRKLKNFVEGYWEAKDKFTTRLYQMRHDTAFYKQAVDGYKNVRIK